MKKIFVKLSLSVMLTVSVFTKAQAAVNENSAEVDWNPVMEAIILVESEGDPTAVSGNSVGAMQITPVLVQECNNILSRRRINKRYTLQDRYDVQKSKEMFLLIQSQYNPANDIEKAIRMWNGGLNYKTRATDIYYQKVMRRMK